MANEGERKKNSDWVFGERPKVTKKEKLLIALQLTNEIVTKPKKKKNETIGNQIRRNSKRKTKKGGPKTLT